jgi:hypothetical protein
LQSSKLTGRNFHGKSDSIDQSVLALRDMGL